MRIFKEDEFWKRVKRNEGCWLWVGSKRANGYGKLPRLDNHKLSVLAHRASWEIHNGEIPKGLCILHRCDNPPCVNPDHLFIGTKGDNNRDTVSKGRNRSGTVKFPKQLFEVIRKEYVPRRAGNPKGNYTKTGVKLPGSMPYLAEKYGMSLRHVYRILKEIT